jgi:hypothetical protein
MTEASGFWYGPVGLWAATSMSSRNGRLPDSGVEFGLRFVFIVGHRPCRNLSCSGVKTAFNQLRQKLSYRHTAPSRLYPAMQGQRKCDGLVNAAVGIQYWPA